MGRSSETFNKREKEKKRLQKRKEKDERKEERKANNKDGKSFEEMLAYVDENGNLTSTPPDGTKKRVVKESDIDLTSRNKGGAHQPTIRVGFIKFFDDAKGFGFIRDKQSQEEFFFHYSSADYAVAQSDAVTFDTEQGPKGINAVRISKAVPASATPTPPPPTPPVTE